MGGDGSGKSGWLTVIEDGLRLDLRQLRKKGLFNPNLSSWSFPHHWYNTKTGEKMASVMVHYSTVPGDSWILVANVDGPNPNAS